MVNDVVIGSALRNTLTSIKRTQNTIDVITERLATGLKVDSALDDPSNFFTAKALRNTASDKARLLDGIGQSIRAIQETAVGLEAAERLIDQAEAVVLESQKALEAGKVDPAIYEDIINTSPQTLSQQISSGDPDVYFRLNETGGPIVDYGVGAAGPVTANYNSGASGNAPPLYTNGGGSPSVQFDGVNDRIRVSDSTMINTSTTPARTVELVFNADTVAGRQVLYEEGATVNGLTIYIDNGLIRVEAEDDQGGNRFGNLDISAPVVAGQTYHVAFVFDGAAQTFSGYLDGQHMANSPLNITSDAVFPSHSGDVGIGGVSGGVQFHDGENGGGNGFNFDGRISDVAIYNRAVSDADLLSHANSLDASTTITYPNRNYDAVLSQIDELVIDANYRGINLLNNETLRTDFNSTGSSFLITEGDDFSAQGLGLVERFNFNEADTLDRILSALREAKAQVRRFGFTIANDLSVIQARRDYTEASINVLNAGADDLTVADLNEEGANQLATQTRLELGTTALSLAAQSQSSVVGLLS